MITAALLGFMIIMQARSFSDYGDVLSRNSRADVFREIQILKTTNDNLESEIEALTERLGKLSTNWEALDSVKEEIETYLKLTGRVDVSGPGISIALDGDIAAIWLVDLVNELLTAGAEAVSVNSIRLTNRTAGFDTIPSGQILINGVTLNRPYYIEAIGDKEVLRQAMVQTQGIIDRMNQNLVNIQIGVEQKDLIEMEKVL